MTGEDWDDGWSEDDSSERTEEGLLSKMGRWLRGESEREEDTDGSLDAEVKAARRRVEEYHSTGRAVEHMQRMQDPSYRASLEYTIAEETEHLERHLGHYDEDCQRSGSDAILSQTLWEERIAVLNQAIAETESALEKNRESYKVYEDRWQGGEISQQEYDDRQHRICREEQTASTRLGMGGLGGGYEEIGDVADQAGHIIEDSLADDDGAMRQKICRKIRAMPRRMALEIIEEAVGDGVISQTTADYLIRECVRSH